MNDPLTLNESQLRSLSITMASVEQTVLRVRQVLAHPPRDSLLNHYTEPLPSYGTGAINQAITEIQQKIATIAEDLRLVPHQEPVRRSLVGALVLADVAVSEVDARRLRGYGSVAAATADYLRRELPQLQALLTQLTDLLAPAGYVERVEIGPQHDSSAK